MKKFFLSAYENKGFSAEDIRRLKYTYNSVFISLVAAIGYIPLTYYLKPVLVGSIIFTSFVFVFLLFLLKSGKDKLTKILFVVYILLYLTYVFFVLEKGQSSLVYFFSFASFLPFILFSFRKDKNLLLGLSFAGYALLIVTSYLNFKNVDPLLFMNVITVHGLILILTWVLTSHVSNTEKEILEYTNSMEEIGYQLKNSLQELQSKTAEAEAWRDQMRVIFDTSRDALFLLDEKGFFDCNPAAVQLFGFEKKEDIVGKTPFDVSPENQPNGETSENAAMARIREAIEKGSAFFEWTHKRKDGSIFPATVLLSAFSWFGKPVLQATVRDITEQKLQEYEIKQKNEELLASEEELRQNSEELQAVNDHLMKVKEDLENSLKELKETQASLVQSEKLAFLGQLVAGVAHEINTPLGAINASNSNSLRLLPSIVQNMLECGSRLNEEENKELQKILLQILDNTTILTSREERQYKKEVSEFLEGIGIFNNSNIASDLVKIGVYKNLNDYVPLLKKIQEVPLIMDILSAVGKMKINLTNTATAVQKTNKIIFALKNYSYKSQVEEAQPFDVVQNLQMILTLYHNQIKHGINLHTKFDENLPNVLGWSDELNQVWTNLITNSLQAMNFQGDLTIEAHQNNGHIEVKISDSGPGIPSEIQDKIFDPFFTTKKQGEGTGLGLGICKKIVEKHKGEISFKSQPGKTEFSVKLPIFNS